MLTAPDLDNKPDFVFTGNEILLLTKPIVYGWRRGDVYLYIGKGGYGLTRPLSNKHHVINVLDQVQFGDSLDIWVKLTNEAAVTFEQELIHKHKPLYNNYKLPPKLPDSVVASEIQKLVDYGRWDLLRRRKCLICETWFWTNLWNQSCCSPRCNMIFIGALCPQSGHDIH